MCCRSIWGSVISSKMHAIMSNIVVCVLLAYLVFCDFIQSAYHHVKYWGLCVAGLFGILLFHPKCIPSCQILSFVCCRSIRDSVISSKMHPIMSNIVVYVLPVYLGFCYFIQNAYRHAKLCRLFVAFLNIGKYEYRLSTSWMWICWNFYWNGHLKQPCLSCYLQGYMSPSCIILVFSL